MEDTKLSTWNLRVSLGNTRCVTNNTKSSTGNLRVSPGKTKLIIGNTNLSTGKSKSPPLSRPNRPPSCFLLDRRKSGRGPLDRSLRRQALYLVHWLTDLAGAEPYPQAGAFGAISAHRFSKSDTRCKEMGMMYG